VARRQDLLTGTNDYPALAETPVKVLDAKPEPPASYPSAVTFAPLPRFRLAEPFEQLREASDRTLAKTGARPKVFIANLGTLAEFNARAAFAKNFFEVGGIEAVSNDGFRSRDAMIAAYKTSGAKLACLCSTDAVYARDGVEAVRTLVAAGARVYLAGRPQEALKAAGVEAFIFAGCDALAALQATHRLIAS